MTDYGSTDSIALLVPRLANPSSRFDNTTTPTFEQVEEWRVEVSAMLDVALAAHNIATPVEDATVVKMLDAFVNSNCASLARAINGQGRYAQERALGAEELLLSLATQVDAWVARYATGIAKILGVAQDSVALNAGYVALIRTDDVSTLSSTEYS